MSKGTNYGEVKIKKSVTPHLIHNYINLARNL